MLVAGLGRFASAQEIQWMQAGKGMYGGTARNLVRSPDGSLYATTSGTLGSESIYRWSGTIWEPVQMDLADASIIGLCVTTAGTLIAPTGRKSVLRSMDSGSTWREVEVGENLGEMCDVDDSGTVFLSTIRSSVLASVDDGMTWTPTGGDLPEKYVTQVIAAAGDTLLVTTAFDRGFFRSADGGLSWESITDFQNQGITVHEAQDGSIFVVVHRFPEKPMVFRSKDSGATWNRISENYHHSHISLIEVLPEGAFFLIDGTQVKVSSDGGRAWRVIGRLPDFPASDAVILPDGQIFLGVFRQGVAHSTDGGKSWEVLKSGMTATVVQALLAHPNGSIWAGTAGNGLFRSDDRGLSWHPVALGKDWGSGISHMVLSPSGAMVVSQGPLYLSSDGGSSWQALPNPVFNVSALEFSPSGELYVGDWTGLFKLSDSGGSWVRVTDAVTAVESIAFAPNGDILLGTASGTDGEHHGVFRSSDGGATWNKAPMDPSSKAVTALVLVNDSTALAGAMRSGHFLSTDGAESFTFHQEQPWTGGFNQFATSAAGTIYAATGGGLLRFSDDGREWSYIGPSGPTDNLLSVAVDDNGHIYLGSDGSGVYRSLYPVELDLDRGEDEIPSQIALAQNYPNPFNLSTTIDYQIRTAGHIRVTVSDLLGRTVAILVDQSQSAGSHQVHFDAAHLPSGMYIYRLETISSYRINEMLLVR